MYVCEADGYKDEKKQFRIISVYKIGSKKSKYQLTSWLLLLRVVVTASLNMSGWWNIKVSFFFIRKGIKVVKSVYIYATPYSARHSHIFAMSAMCCAAMGRVFLFF